MIELPLLRPETVHRATLPNGLTVLVRRDDSAPVVAIVTYVKAGYFDETDDVVGVSHVLEHMYFKGTERRGVGEISKETKAAGGYLNAGTIYDHTSYYTVLPASRFARGLDIQADAYAHSVIDGDELRKELEVIIQEVKRKADNPEALTIETLYEVLHDRHRMRRWRMGREAGLRALTRDDVLRFYRTYYRPRNTLLCIAGDVDPDDALRRAEGLYGELPDRSFARDRGPGEEGPPAFRYRELSSDVTQTRLAFGWRTPPMMHFDTPLLDLAASVLGAGRASRLYRAVRERKLAASVSAYNYTPTELGVFVAHADGPPATALAAARAVWHQVRELRDEGARRDELWRARRVFEARWVRRLETMEGQANYLAEWQAEGDWTLGDRYLERLLTATEEQVTDAVRRHLAPERCGAVVYRPEDAPALAADAGTFRDQLARERPGPLPVPPPRRASLPGVAGEPPSLEHEEGRVRVYRTEHGVPILVRRKGGAPLVHIGIHALGGASDEAPSLAGLTLLLARTAMKGTQRRSATQVAEDAELMGGSIAAAAGAESFGWSLSVPAVHAGSALELLADVVQFATIPEDALETERAVALADLETIRDDMYRFPVRLLAQAAFAGHPYGIPATGTESSLAAIDAERVRAWHLARVAGGPVVISIVGDVDPDDVARSAARCFPLLRMGEPTALSAPAWRSEPDAAVVVRDKAQTALALGFPAPARCDNARYAAQLVAGLASGLGGRFFDELRDRQSLAYTVQAFPVERRLAGMFVAYIATSPDKEEVARRGLLDEFARLRDAPVTDDELARAKEYAIGTHAIRQGSGAAVLGDLVDAWLLGGRLAELEEHDAHVRAVTPDDIQALAARYFDEGRVVQGIVRGVGKTV